MISDRSEYERMALACAEAIVEGPVDTGTITRLLVAAGIDTEEFQMANNYICNFATVEEFHSIKFMLACFTLLEAGDDNF